MSHDSETAQSPTPRPRSRSNRLIGLLVIMAFAIVGGMLIGLLSCVIFYYSLSWH